MHFLPILTLTPLQPVEIVLLFMELILLDNLRSIGRSLRLQIIIGIIIPPFRLRIFLMQFKIGNTLTFPKYFLQLLKLELLDNILAIIDESLIADPLTFILDLAEDSPEQVFDLIVDQLECTVILVQLAATFGIQPIEDLLEFAVEELRPRGDL